MKKTIIPIVGFLISAALLAACATSADTSVLDGVSSSLPVSSAVLSAPSVNEVLSLPAYESPVDFPALTEKGEDICGWLVLGGTNIDYPVTLGIDNAYYLTHDAYGEYFEGGALFIDMSNAADFSDPVTVSSSHFLQHPGLSSTNPIATTR